MPNRKDTAATAARTTAAVQEAERNRGGRRAILDDPERRKQILDLIAAGVPIAHAAAVAGVSDRSIISWLAQGREAQEREDAGQAPQPHDERYLRFLHDVEAARGRAVTQAISNIQRAARGGYVRSRKTSRDEQGNPVVEEVFADVEWRASAFLLERQHRAQFGKAQYVDVNVLGTLGALGLPEAAGASPAAIGGGAVAPGAEVDSLAERLAAVRAQQESDAAWEDDVVEAELLPDE